mgnify:CR=1 FL=1
MKKISTRIILLVLLCSIPMAVGATSIYRSMKAIEDLARDNLVEEAKNHSESINKKLLVYETTNHGISQLIQSVVNMSFLGDEDYLENHINNILDPTIKRTITKTENCMGMSVGFHHSFTGKTEGAWWVLGENGDIERFVQNDLSGKDPKDPSLKWYYDAFSSKKGNWSAPYVNDKGLNVITYSEPIIANSVPIGVVTVDLNLEGISAEVNNIKLFETGYGYLLSKEFDYLVHPSLDSSSNFMTINNGQYKSIGEEMEEKGLGIVETKFDGEIKLMSFAKLIDGKILVLTVPRNEILSTMYNTIYIIVIVMIISIIF